MALGGGGGPSSIGSAGGASALYGVGAPASETDGETFDGDADFDDYDVWDYAEILGTLYVVFWFLFVMLLMPSFYNICASCQTNSWHLLLSTAPLEQSFNQ